MNSPKKRGSKSQKLTPKTKNEDQKINTQDSFLFSPFRTIGYVTNHVPFDIMIRGSSFLLSSSVGRNIQTYDVRNLLSLEK